MKATNGSGSFRSRGRLIGCCMALAAVLSALMFAPSASAMVNPVKDYVALGDSLAFGFTQVKYTENKPNEAPSFFENGYADFYLKKVRANKAENKKGTVLINDGCPGESSASFLGEGVAKSPFFTKNCEYQAAFTACGPCGGGPLHNPYPGKSQMSNALSILKEGAPAHPISVISLNIGANDELASVAVCKATVKKEYEEKGVSEQPGGPYPPTPGGVQGAINACIGSSAGATFFAINKNIEKILEEIYVTGKYTGKTVVLGFFNPFTFLLPGSDALQKSLNEYIEANAITNYSAQGAVYANPFVTFNGTFEGTKAEEAKICKYTEMCNPTAIAENKAKDEAKKAKEVEEGKTFIYPFNPKEGDIHPTQLGYEKLAKVMYEAAPL